MRKPFHILCLYRSANQIEPAWVGLINMKWKKNDIYLLCFVDSLFVFVIVLLLIRPMEFVVAADSNGLMLFSFS